MQKLPSKLNVSPVIDEGSYWDIHNCPIAKALKAGGFPVGEGNGNIFIGAHGVVFLRTEEGNKTLGQYRFPGAVLVSFYNLPKGELHLRSVDE